MKKRINHTDELLSASCKEKANRMNNCNEEEKCPCSNSLEHKNKMIDLIVLIDSSGSMAPHWQKVSDAVTEGISKATKECKTKANVTYLYVDRIQGSTNSEPSNNPPVSGTVFQNSHEAYLINLGESGPFQTGDIGDYPGEEGAEAIMDLSSKNHWTKNACRAILYISDEGFETDYSSTGDTNGIALAHQAAVVANANNVTVFTHYIGNNLSDANEFQILADETGGDCRIEMNMPGGFSDITVDDYVELLSDTICNGCGKTKCIEVEVPEIKPCISISWGDSECDCLESDDVETLCITVCNCYSNLTLQNFVIGKLDIVDSLGNSVALLPDGTPSVKTIPMGPICFDNIEPCKDGEISCKSREFALYSRGAKAGEYKIILDNISYDVGFEYTNSTCFDFSLCNS